MRSRRPSRAWSYRGRGSAGGTKAELFLASDSGRAPRDIEPVASWPADGVGPGAEVADLFDERDRYTRTLADHGSNPLGPCWQRFPAAHRQRSPRGPSAPRARTRSHLVAFVRSEAGDHFQIEVAAHPEFHPDALSADVDLACFKRKIEAGAISALTQSFYNADAYFHFVESCSRFGVTLPIVQSVWDGQRLDEERRTAFTPPEDVRSDNSWTVRMSWPSSSRRAEGAYPASSDPRDLRRHDGTSTIPS